MIHGKQGCGWAGLRQVAEPSACVERFGLQGPDLDALIRGCKPFRCNTLEKPSMANMKAFDPRRIY
jgi:hypothetical protein